MNRYFPRNAVADVALVMATLSAACSDVPTAPPTAPPPRAATPDITSALTTLWDQVSTATLIVAGTTPVDIVRATDFVVPAGATWSVQEIVVPGGAPPQNPTANATLGILADAAGAPGSLIWQATLTPVSATENSASFLGYYDYRYVLATPVSLPAGRYWFKSPCSAETLLCMLDVPIRGLVSYEATGGGSSSWLVDDDYDTAFALFGVAETPASATTDLQSTVNGLGLAAGTTTSLQAKLKRVADALAEGNVAAACTALTDFVNEVTAQSGKKITVAQAQTLISEANRIRGLLGCQ